MTATETPGIEFAAARDDRQWLLVLAYRKRGLPNLSVVANLEAISPLRGCALGEAFDELRDALALRDALEDGSVSWVDAMPDATGYDRDGQALEAAMRRVEDALDALLGEA